MPFSEELQIALSESLNRDDVAVRWRKGSSLNIWIFRQHEDDLILVGYGRAFRNWRQDPLHRDVFTMLDLDAAPGYQKAVFEMAQEVVYPVMFKRLGDDGPKKVSKSTGDLYRRAVTIKKFNTRIGSQYGVRLEPGKKPDIGQDKTQKIKIKR